MTRSLSRLLSVSPLAFVLVAAPSFAQTPTVPNAKFWAVADHIDLAVTGFGEFTKTVSGPVVAKGANNYGNLLQESASSTVGPMATIRYTPKPYVGFELNYGEARYTVNFDTLSIVAPNQGNAFSAHTFQVQTQYNEYTLGYVVRPPHTFFGVQPFASGGAGTIYFKPTRGGGQEEPKQPRAVYYYNVGLEAPVTPHFGVRAGWRQTFYLAPDYLTNYETILKRTNTKEPYAGFYLRF